MIRIPLTACVLALVCACGSGDDTAGAADAAGDSDGAPTADAGTQSSGCGVAPPATGTIDGTIMVRGEQRTYTLAVPTDYDRDTPYALVFGWHGRGSNGPQARSYFGIEQASAGAAIVVYPQGLPINGNAADTGWDLEHDGVDVAFFDGLLERLSAEYCIAPSRVYSTGHSFGGYMTNLLGCVRSGPLAGIAPVAGGGPVGVCDGGPVPAWITHGMSDAINNFVFGEGSRDHWIEVNGCADTTTPVSPSPCEAYDGCGANPVVWCPHNELELSGHVWPTFAAEGIWSFFDSLD